MNYKEFLFNKDKILSFCPELAVIFNDYDSILVKESKKTDCKEKKPDKNGLGKAIVVNQINYWLELNEKSNKNFVDGYYWTHNSYEKWVKEDFPYWSVDTVKRIFLSLEKIGVLVSANYNKWSMDKTKWYRIDYDELQKIIDIVQNQKEKQVAPIESEMRTLVGATCTNRRGNLHQAIPEINNIDYITENINTENIYDVSSEYTSSFDDRLYNNLDKIYAPVPQERGEHSSQKANHDKKISKICTYGDLQNHIKQIIEQKDINSEDCCFNEQLVLDVICQFYADYNLNMGKPHRIMSDMAYSNVIDRFLDSPECLDDADLNTYKAMIVKYFMTNYRPGTERSLSHFMSNRIRENLYQKIKNDV
jgi:hypothetical protein